MCVFPDYLTMDIEGQDYAVLKNYDLKSNGLLVLTVETAIRDYSDLNHEKMRRMLSDKEYIPLVKYGPNVTYIRKELFQRAALGV